MLFRFGGCGFGVCVVGISGRLKILVGGGGSAVGAVLAVTAAVGLCMRLLKFRQPKIVLRARFWCRWFGGCCGRGRWISGR